MHKWLHYIWHRRSSVWERTSERLLGTLFSSFIPLFTATVLVCVCVSSLVAVPPKSFNNQIHQPNIFGDRNHYQKLHNASYEYFFLSLVLIFLLIFNNICVLFWFLDCMIITWTYRSISHDRQSKQIHYFFPKRESNVWEHFAQSFSSLTQCLLLSLSSLVNFGKSRRVIFMRYNDNEGWILGNELKRHR